MKELTSSFRAVARTYWTKPSGITIAPYSSQGPTNDGRVKPDISAVACVNSASYAPGCFNGTSASTPVVAGAVALAWAGGAAGTPAGIAT
jgi:hypothetical protein